MDLLKKCELCPRRCGADRTSGERGFCGAGEEIRIARAALHFWEEPPISGERGSGAVFFSHCTMKCAFCQNSEISACGRGKNVSDEELAEIFLRLQGEGAHNINLVTPTHYTPQIIGAIDIARSHGLAIPIVWNSSGYERVETLKMLEGRVDVYLPDFKYFSDKYAARYSRAENYFETASSAVAEMFRQCGEPTFENGIMTRGVIVRHLMLPSLLFDTKKIIDYLYGTYGDKIYISLMSQYTPTEGARKFPDLSRRLDERHYRAMVEYCAERGITRAFVQDTDAAGEEFIPKFYGERETLRDN